MTMRRRLAQFLILWYALAGREVWGFLAGHSNNNKLAKLPTSFVILSESIIAPDDAQQEEAAHASTATKRRKLRRHFAALEPGAVVQVQVGDMALARKAWKKRRRSGSPLWVPCSVLSVDRTHTVRGNLMYLLDKFGVSPNRKNKKHKGIRLSVPELRRRYRSHLQSSLPKQATQLGMDSVADLVKHLFPQDLRAQEQYGVQLVVQEQQSPQPRLSLHSAQSRIQARTRANQAAILQFVEMNVVDDDNDSSNNDTPLEHTGWVRIKTSSSSSDNKPKLPYELQPLSAAMRVSQKEDVETGNIQNGSVHTAVVVDYDPEGDAGAPIIFLSLKPLGGSGRNSHFSKQIRRQRGSKQQLPSPPPPVTLSGTPQFNLKDLTMGYGPIQGRVVQLIKGGMWVDCGVGRTLSDPKEYVQVLGFLQRNDGSNKHKQNSQGSSQKQRKMDIRTENADAEEWGESLSFHDPSDDGEGALEGYDDSEEEDITDLFEIADDGSLLYKDEETGETRVVSTLSEETEENETETDDDDNDTDDGPVVLQRPPEQKRLAAGDKVTVFVESVSKQSSRLQLTLDPNVQGKKALDVKREAEARKKKARLSKQLGGLKRIEELRGSTMDGIVKARSKTGDWLYVQPTENDLPVGMATVPDDLALAEGDAVIVRLEGIDASRGQLALRVLQKQN